MSVTLKLALGEMSTRRRLLLQSLVERAGGRLSPRWELVTAPDEADVLLFDPVVGEPETTARALPVVERADYVAGEGPGLCFPATTAEFCAFLEGAARTLEAPPHRLLNAPPQPLRLLGSVRPLPEHTVLVVGAPRGQRCATKRLDATRRTGGAYALAPRLPAVRPLPRP